MKYNWTRKKIPKVNDLFNGNHLPAAHIGMNPSIDLNTNEEYLNELELPDGYHNFIRLLIYLPEHSRVVLPKFTYDCRIKHYT